MQLMGSPARLAPIVTRAAFVAVVAWHVLYFGFLRPTQMRWGATDVEVATALPGDRAVGNATFVATRAMTIDATPEQVWPWIVKMGAAERRFVKGFEVNRYMLWLTRTPPRVSWCWSLAQAGPGRTRVVTRVRFSHAWLAPGAWRVVAEDFRNFYVVRKALFDVKAAAEASARR